MVHRTRNRVQAHAYRGAMPAPGPVPDHPPPAFSDGLGVGAQRVVRRYTPR